MAAPIQRLTRLASKTFSRFNAAEGFQNDRLTQLSSAFNEITAADVNFDPEVIRERDRLSTDKAPVTYIHLWEDDTFSMGIFVVKRGGRLPLHDHPGMFGLLKVLHGTLKLSSFSETGETNVPVEMTQPLQKWQVPLVKSVKLETETNLSAEQGCCQLTPTSGNFHEITPVTEMAAFVDILAPPYDQSGSRDCHYYREMPVPGVDTGSGSKDSRWIIRVPQPMDFWCDSVDYTGPLLDPSDT
ncbi:2-aminoethanethiol dioxygenase-like [Littorina saxatilis]|uniref:2-aminoethanethiol dioxygenase n=1 Tax=Littorina saxatilis TaxID=31220 RepID=A0AAN9GL28_9CAEN